MKIAVFHNLPPGGAKRTVWEQVKHLVRKNEVHLFILSDTDESFLPLSPLVSRVHRYNFRLSSNRLIADFQKFFILPLIHRRMSNYINNHCDLLIAHPDKLTQAPHLLRYVRCPKLYFCQELLRIAYEPELKIKQKLPLLNNFYELLTRVTRKTVDRINAQRADVILANSAYTGNKIASHYQITPIICHLGVDPRVFQPIETQTRNQILFVDQPENHMSDYKLVTTALKKLSPKQRPTLKILRFSNAGPTLSKDHQIAVEYSKSLLVTCSSTNEPFGLASIESMACETPVLAVNEGGYKETVADGKTGWLLPRDPDNFAAKIKLLIENPQLARKMGKAGRRHILSHFTWNHHMSTLDRAMANLMESSARTSHQPFFSPKSIHHSP